MPPNPDDDLPERMQMAIRFLKDPCQHVRSRAIRLRWGLKYFARALGIRVEVLAGEPGKPPPQTTPAEK